MENGFQDLSQLRGLYSTSDNLIENFYIPVLSAATRVDRSAGFFNSSSLSLAARGLARFIANGGQMRLLVGCDLRREDVEAIERGTTSLEAITQAKLVSLFQEPKDEVEQMRLEALAWMIAVGTLTIRVGLPRGEEGYFHVKHGIATDGQGHRIAWQGSNNETLSGWVKNYEELWVSPSWEGGWTEQQVRETEKSFRQIWEDQHPDWTTIPIPEAARQKLLNYKPDQAPIRDPEEEPVLVENDGLVGDREAVIAAWLRDVPYLLGMEGRLGGTGAIQPWPHQHRVAHEVVSRFPERFLLADEVGLGKTIEVGLVLRELVLSKRARKCLILAPASVLVQWQGELFEKFGMAVPIYDGHQLKDAGPEQTVRSLGHPTAWTEEPVVLVSSQLVKRTERRGEIWDGPGWDLVVIDEAHHARRKGFDPNQRRPNRLLELLEGTGDRPGLAAKTRGLLLLTATPMQVHPVEVWDMLIQLGLPGRWGAHEQYFLRYFQELRKAPSQWTDVNWRLVTEMARDELDHGGPVDKDIENRIKGRLGWVGWDRLQQCLTQPSKINRIRKPDERAALLKVLEHLTPLRRRMHRNTRDLLRVYQKQDLLPGRLADRLPEPRWVEMAPDEKALYDRVEEYISEFYNRYEQQRRGLGFVMTVYRRRLTSSFYAVEQSLKRRLKVLQGHQQTGMSEEDLEEDDLTADVGETLEALEEHPDQVGTIFAEEIRYVEDFLQELRNLGSDTKYAQLVRDLTKALEQRTNVVIFTQYTDTMDYLREQLRDIYGRRIACYSGRGGERWADGQWERVGKEEIKGAFRKGEIQILLGNDAMAEGLNLQTCGIEINYDVPWNPMKLEQRIGRVDRIGQRYPTVWIWSYFLEDTIEAEVYRRLMDRIDWFTSVVGSLQPILHQVRKTIEKLALEPGKNRPQEMNKAIQQITTNIVQTEQDGMEVEKHLTQTMPPNAPRPLAEPNQLKGFFTTSQTLGHHFRPYPGIDDAYQVEWNGQEHLVTFSAELANERSDTLRLLTFGATLFEQLLNEAKPPPVSQFDLIRMESREDGLLRVGWYRNHEGQANLISDLSELIEAMDHADQRPDFPEQAQWAFNTAINEETLKHHQKTKRINKERNSVALEQGRYLLTEACYIWAAQHSSLFDAETPPISDAILDAMTIAEGYPWAPLRRLIDNGIRLSSESERWREITTRTDHQLRGLWPSLNSRAEQIVDRLAGVEHGSAVPH